VRKSSSQLPMPPPLQQQKQQQQQQQRQRQQQQQSVHPVNNITTNNLSNSPLLSPPSSSSSVNKKNNHDFNNKNKGDDKNYQQRYNSILISNKLNNTKTKKLFRKKKVLRTWVLPTIFLISLFMLWLEFYIGKIISLDDIQDIYEDQIYGPWELLLMDMDESDISDDMDYRDDNNRLFSLPNISYAPRTTKCPQGQRRMINIHNPLSHSISIQTRLIPMIVHQQSKTRCLTIKVDRATIKWAFRRVSNFVALFWTLCFRLILIHTVLSIFFFLVELLYS